MSEHFKRLGPIAGPAARLDRFLDTAIAALKGAPPPSEPRSVAMPPVTLPKPRATGMFFSLVDLCQGSERRLDDLALPLADEILELEQFAAAVIDSKRDDVAKARDYLGRLRGNVEKLEETKLPGAGDNKGPPLAEGSAALPPPSPDATPSPPPSPEGEEGTPA